ncbi:MAG: hypothetical protein V4572_05445 [Bacteroidota bacterium]
MKKIIFIAFLFCIRVYSQDISGNWKIISYEDNVVYYNNLKDSVSYKDISRKDEADDILIIYKPRLSTLTFDLDKNGKFTLNGHDRQKAFGRYSINQQSGKIVFSENGKKQKHEIQITLVNETLYLKFQGETGFFTMGFKK